MQTLQSFLEDRPANEPEQGAQGQLTPWLSFCDLSLQTGQLCICDPSFAPPAQDMEVSLSLPPGHYRVEARGIAYGNDHRVAALRVISSTAQAFETGAAIGEVGVDTGRIGMCDAKTFGDAVDRIGEDAFSDLLDNSAEGADILEAEPGIIFPFVDSGFGDGTYPVRELRSAGKLVGMEVTLIEENTPYPFGGDSSSETAPDADDQANEDLFSQLLTDMLNKAKTVRDSGQGNAKDAMRAAMEEMINQQAEKFRGEFDEFRQHLIEQRREAPVTRTKVIPAKYDLPTKPEVELQMKALQSLGYRLVGQFEFENIPNFLLILFLHDQDGTIATISCGKTITTELAAKYPNDSWFAVRDTAAIPGLAAPPWLTYRYEPGSTLPEMQAIFQTERPGQHLKLNETLAVESLAEDFRRTQEWRMERGGWTRDEVRQQLKLPPLKEGDDDLNEALDEACLNVREKWLYAWFKDQHPDQATRLFEELVIVHDELESALLQALWILGEGNTRVRKAEFQNGTPREAFRLINQANDTPFELIAQKQGGFAADYYKPFSKE